MLRRVLCCISLLIAAGTVRADPAALAPDKPKEKPGDKQMSGMSILGNDDAPKALVIVPWKSSELGDPLAVSRALDDGRQPVDRDVFMRELDYYQIRASSAGADSSDTR